VTAGWAVVVSPPPGLCSRRCLSVSGCRMRCGASVTCAPLRRRQMACCSRACPYPAAALLCHLGPLLHFKKSASGCCQPPPAGGPLAADLSNCTRRISVGDGRVAAGVSELGPAMSDGESGFPANYSRSGPTIIRDYSRRPRRGRAHAPDYGAAEPGLRSHWPRIKVGSGNLNRGRRQLKPGPEAT
jgi:hypothetical protein